MSREVLKEKIGKIVLKRGFNRDIKILDVGCGNGDMLGLMAVKGFKNLYGCDIEEGLEFKSVNFKKVDLNRERVPFEEKFDLVFCVEVIEHLENPFKLIRNLRSCMKEDGILILTKPHATNLWNRLWFLLSGNVIRFHPKNNHITFTTGHTFDKVIKNKFKIIKKYTEFGVVPLLRVKHPAPVFLGNTLIYEMKRL